jgi:hypothetical protein
MAFFKAFSDFRKRGYEFPYENELKTKALIITTQCIQKIYSG